MSSLHTDQCERIEARLSRTGGAFLRPVSGDSKVEAAEFHFIVVEALGKDLCHLRRVKPRPSENEVFFGKLPGFKSWAYRGWELE